MVHQIPPWKVISSETIAECKVFSVNRNRSCVEIDETQKAHNFYVLHPSDWVNVIPVTDDGCVVLIEQFRHGIGQFTLEIPGGMVDPEDTSVQDAAARELLEETGFIAESWSLLGINHPNPAMQSNICHTYLATGARQIETPQFEGTENIAIKLVPLEQIHELISNGTITHALVIVAFHLLNLKFQQWKETQAV